MTEKNTESMTQEKITKSTEEKNKKRRILLWILGIILLLLVLLTTIILIVRIGDFAPVDTNTVFLIEKEFEFQVDDKNKVWNKKTNINLFKTEYKNEDSEILVSSENNENVIAPGTTNSYTFNLKNTGNIAIDYKVEIEPSLKINHIKSELIEIPILVRIKNYNNKYFIGNENSYEPIENLKNFSNKGTLAANNYAYYTLEWKWESNTNNILDTTLGTKATNEEIELNIEIITNAEVADEADATGGIQAFKEDKKIGGKINIIPFIILILILIITICLTIKVYIKYKNDMKNNKRGEDIEA